MIVVDNDVISDFCIQMQTDRPLTKLYHLRRTSVQMWDELYGEKTGDEL